MDLLFLKYYCFIEYGYNKRVINQTIKGRSSDEGEEDEWRWTLGYELSVTYTSCLYARKI